MDPTRFGVASFILLPFLVAASVVDRAGVRSHAASVVDRAGVGSHSIALTKRVVRVYQDSKQGLQHKMAYFGDLGLGKPHQTFSVVFDTGSGNLIVPGSDCVSQACTVHDQFAEKLSPTVKHINCDGSDVVEGTKPDEITITFGTGSITGRCLRDEICVGNACSTGDFIASTKESSSPFATFEFDGVLGLALQSMARSVRFSMMSRLMESKVLKQPVFSVFLSDSDAETSEITFGDIKQEHMASDLFWVPVTGVAGYWEVKIDDITLDGKKQQLCEDCRVAVDTGTSQLAGPTTLVGKLRDVLSVSPDCSNYESLPKLGFIIGGRILTLSPRDYVEKMGSSCDLALMSLDVPPPKGPLFIFGIPFLQKYYSVYDHEKERVGFAVAKHAGEEPETLVAIDAQASSSGGNDIVPFAKDQSRAQAKGFLLPRSAY